MSHFQGHRYDDGGPEGEAVKVYGGISAGFDVSFARTFGVTADDLRRVVEEAFPGEGTPLVDMEPQADRFPARYFAFTSDQLALLREALNEAFAQEIEA